jgi:hypothetical protein
MKTWGKIVVSIGTVALVVLMFLVFDYGRKTGSKDVDRITAEFQSYRDKADSILAITPDTIRDTVIIRPDPEVKWYERIVHEPAAVVDYAGTYLYRDSLVNEELAFYLLDSINGKVMWRKMGYRLFVPKEVTIKEEVIKEVPVFVDKPVPTYYDGFRLSGGVGGGSAFAYSVGAGYSKGRSLYGVEYLRFGGTNNWMLSYSYLIYKRK